MKYRKGSFIVVPSRDILKGMNPTAQCLYMWLCSYANETGECFPSRTILAGDCGCSVRMIDSMLEILIKEGLIIKTNRVNKNEKITNLYSVIVKGGSAGGALPSAGGALPLAQEVRIELNPVLTQSTYTSNARALRGFSIQRENTEESTERLPRARLKYPNAKKVFSLFPKQEKSWAINTTELKYAELLWERGEEDVKKAIAYVNRHKDDDFIPRVTKPSDLEKKWTDIAEYAKYAQR